MRLYYEALSKIPKKFIHKDTRSTMFGENSVIIANPKYPPMVYKKFDRRWVVMTFTPGRFFENEKQVKETIL